jgi:hypothetical protein
MYTKSKKGIYTIQKSAYVKVCALLSYKKHLILKMRVYFLAHSRAPTKFESLERCIFCRIKLRHLFSFFQWFSKYSLYSK